MWVRHQCGAWLTAFVAAAGVCAGEGMPLGYFHGTMVSFEGTATIGVITARAASGDVFDCGYDSKSYLELAKQRITVSKLRAGDWLEVLADHSGRSRACYIRMLKVLPPEDGRPHRAPKATRPAPRLTPTATFTLSGIVISKEPGTITIRGRDREETMLMRRDTRFVGDGAKTDLAGLALNQRVFVEAGRNIDGELEAYQVTWGGILTVR